MIYDIIDISRANDDYYPMRSLTDDTESCLPVEIKWLAKLIVEEFPAAWVNSKINNYDLYQNYKQSLPSRSEPDIGQFGETLVCARVCLDS